MKKNDPLGYVRMMMEKRGSSSEKGQSDVSTHSSEGTNETSYDELLRRVKAIVFEVDLFDVLKKDITACYQMKKLIGQINITAFPSNIGEALIDTQHLIEQISVEHSRERDIILDPNEAVNSSK